MVETDSDKRSKDINRIVKQYNDKSLTNSQKISNSAILPQIFKSKCFSTALNSKVISHLCSRHCSF